MLLAQAPALLGRQQPGQGGLIGRLALLMGLAQEGVELLRLVRAQRQRLLQPLLSLLGRHAGRVRRTGPMGRLRRMGAGRRRRLGRALGRLSPGREQGREGQQGGQGLAAPGPQPLDGGYAVDEAGQRLYWQGQVLLLTPLEFRLLRLLLRQPGRVLSRAQPLEQLHEDFRDVSDRVIDSHVKNIRRKLAQLSPPQDPVSAVYGVGYRLDLLPPS